MATKTIYASDLVCQIICSKCEENPCPFQCWTEKNACQKIIAYNKELGKCCATCMHCVEGKYCSEKAKGVKVDALTDFSRFRIDDIFEHTCKKWTNTFEEE
jgi:hypothetical protein